MFCLNTNKQEIVLESEKFCEIILWRVLIPLLLDFIRKGDIRYCSRFCFLSFREHRHSCSFNNSAWRLHWKRHRTNIEQEQIKRSIFSSFEKRKSCLLNLFYLLDIFKLSTGQWRSCSSKEADFYRFWAFPFVHWTSFCLTCKSFIISSTSFFFFKTGMSLSNWKRSDLCYHCRDLFDTTNVFLDICVCLLYTLYKSIYKCVKLFEVTRWCDSSEPICFADTLVYILFNEFIDLHAYSDNWFNAHCFSIWCVA